MKRYGHTNFNLRYEKIIASKDFPLPQHYFPGTGCIVNHYMNPNIISIPLEEGNLIQLGLVRRNDVFLPDELMVSIDFLTTALKKSAPKDGLLS
jgi:hypothetical protein